MITNQISSDEIHYSSDADGSVSPHGAAASIESWLG